MSGAPVVASSNVWVEVAGVVQKYDWQFGDIVRTSVTAKVRGSRQGGGKAHCILSLGWASNLPQEEVLIDAPADGALSGHHYVTFTYQQAQTQVGSGTTELKLHVARASDPLPGLCQIDDAFVEVAVR